jgi:hypothetical protein
MKRNNYNVSIKYPIFTGPAAGFRALNTELRKTAMQQYHDAIKEHASDRLEPKGEFTATYKVETVSNDVASLRCDIDDYTPDAATSSAEIRTLNYTFTPLREIKISNLFKDNVDYQEVLTVLSMGRLSATTSDATWSFNATSEEFEDFALDKQGLILFFKSVTPNEVIRVSIPLHQIRHLMDDSLVNKDSQKKVLPMVDAACDYGHRRRI